MDISKFDFVRLTWSDTNGIARCKIVPNHGFDSSVKSIGVGMCSLATVFDATTTPAPYDKVFNVGCPDEYIVPQLETLHECPWGGTPTEKIGQFFLTPKIEAKLGLFCLYLRSLSTKNALKKFFRNLILTWFQSHALKNNSQKFLVCSKIETNCPWYL